MELYTRIIARFYSFNFFIQGYSVTVKTFLSGIQWKPSSCGCLKVEA